MAEIEEVIYSKLSAHAGLATLVSTRVYPDQLPQLPTLPAVTYARISTQVTNTRDNTSGGLERPRFQFDCWALTRIEARAVAGQVRSALLTFKQASNPRVYLPLLQDDRDLLDAETNRYRSLLDVFIWHEEQ